MNIEQFLTDKVAAAVSTLYGNAGAPLQIQKTRKEFEGDYTLVVFPLLKASRKSPEATATEIGEYLVANTPEIKAFNVIKGFLNLSLDSAFWAARFREVAANDTFGQAAPTGRTVMIEYSSPNTNKPLHLGHIRNNLLGYSVAQILKANGNKVIKVNLIDNSKKREYVKVIVSMFHEVTSTQKRNSYRGFIYKDKNDLIRKELRYIPTPVMIIVDNNCRIRDACIFEISQDKKQLDDFIKKCLSIDD